MGRGIGRAIALKLASEGARLVINDLDAEPAQQTVDEIRAARGHAVVCAGNVTDAGFAARFIDMAVSHFGGLDIIVNNAGFTWDGVIQKMTDAQWQAILDCHLTAPFRILRAAQPVIRDLAKKDAEAGRRGVRKGVNISSVSGLFGNAAQVNYAAAKAGIGGVARTLAKEWGRMNVTVNGVAFGLVHTRVTASTDDAAATRVDGRDRKLGINPGALAAIQGTIPLGRGGTPQEAAGAVCLRCIPESDDVSGETVVCAGGMASV